MPGLGDALYWSGHMLRHSPDLLLKGGRLAIERRTLAPPAHKKILVGTHHKVLTVFLARVFRVFARFTARSYALGMGEALDYSRDIIIDHHSRFCFDRLEGDWVGLHVVRDPRDLIVSGANYHTRSREVWLHLPREDFGGKTYQQAILALPTLEDRLVFEIENQSGREIEEMLRWDFTRPEMRELRYDQLVGERAVDSFCDAISDWGLPAAEQDLLVAIFLYFSIGEPGARSNKHIRNAASGQWREHFTPRVMAAFDAQLPGAVETLGFNEHAGPAA